MPDKSNFYRWFLICSWIMCAFIGAVCGGVSVYLATSQSIPTAITESQPETIVQGSGEIVVYDNLPGREVIQFSNTDIETTITQVVETISPAVVTVIGTTSAEITAYGIVPEQEVSGSGVIVSLDGYILTNNHVVEGTNALSVILADGSELSATIINVDVFADLAVLKADGVMPAAAPLGNSDNLTPGETVIAIGSPLGDFINSVTVGVVSAIGRTLDTGYGYRMEGLIQTDAAINQGNSGGALVNLNGEVIGINTLIIRGSNRSTIAEGLGFAIPSTTVHIISEQIIEKGYFARPYLGVQVQTIDPYIAKRYGLPVNWGAYITNVERNSPAQNSNIQRGDIIVRIGEKDIDESTSFVNALFYYSPGDIISVSLVRNNSNIEQTVTLGQMISN